MPLWTRSDARSAVETHIVRKLDSMGPLQSQTFTLEGHRINSCNRSMESEGSSRFFDSGSESTTRSSCLLTPTSEDAACGDDLWAPMPASGRRAVDGFKGRSGEDGMMGSWSALPSKAAPSNLSKIPTPTDAFSAPETPELLSPLAPLDSRDSLPTIPDTISTPDQSPSHATPPSHPSPNPVPRALSAWEPPPIHTSLASSTPAATPTTRPPPPFTTNPFTSSLYSLTPTPVTNPAARPPPSPARTDPFASSLYSLSSTPSATPPHRSTLSAPSPHSSNTCTSVFSSSALYAPIPKPPKPSSLPPRPQPGAPLYRPPARKASTESHPEPDSPCIPVPAVDISSSALFHPIANPPIPKPHPTPAAPFPPLRPSAEHPTTAAARTRRESVLSVTSVASSRLSEDGARKLEAELQLERNLHQAGLLQAAGEMKQLMERKEHLMLPAMVQLLAAGRHHDASKYVRYLGVKGVVEQLQVMMVAPEDASPVGPHQDGFPADAPKEGVRIQAADVLAWLCQDATCGLLVGLGDVVQALLGFSEEGEEAAVREAGLRVLLQLAYNTRTHGKVLQGAGGLEAFLNTITTALAPASPWSALIRQHACRAVEFLAFGYQVSQRGALESEAGRRTVQALCRTIANYEEEPETALAAVEALSAMSCTPLTTEYAAMFGGGIEALLGVLQGDITPEMRGAALGCLGVIIKADGKYCTMAFEAGGCDVLMQGLQAAGAEPKAALEVLLHLMEMDGAVASVARDAAGLRALVQLVSEAGGQCDAEVAFLLHAVVSEWAVPAGGEGGGDLSVGAFGVMEALIRLLSSPTTGAPLAAAAALFELQQRRSCPAAVVRGAMISRGIGPHLRTSLTSGASDELLQCLLLMLTHEVAGDAAGQEHLLEAGVLDCAALMLKGQDFSGATLWCLMIVLARMSRGTASIQDHMVAHDLVPTLLHQLGGVFQKAVRGTPAPNIAQVAIENRAVAAFLNKHLAAKEEPTQMEKRLSLEILDGLTARPTSLPALLTCNMPDHKVIRRLCKTLSRSWGAKFSARILGRMAEVDPSVIPKILEFDGAAVISKCMKNALADLSVASTYCVGWVADGVRVMHESAAQGEFAGGWRASFGSEGSMRALAPARWAELDFKPRGLRMRNAEEGWDLLVESADGTVSAGMAVEAREVLGAVADLLRLVMAAGGSELEVMVAAALHERLLDVAMVLARECRLPGEKEVGAVAVMRGGGDLAMVTLSGCAMMVRADVVPHAMSLVQMVKELVVLMRGAPVEVAESAADVVEAMLVKQVVTEVQMWELLSAGMVPVVVSCLGGGAGPAVGAAAGCGPVWSADSSSRRSSCSSNNGLMTPSSEAAAAANGDVRSGSAHVQVVAARMLALMAQAGDVFLDAAAGAGIMEQLVPLLSSSTAPTGAKHYGLQVMTAILKREEPTTAATAQAIPAGQRAKKPTGRGMVARLLSGRKASEDVPSERRTSASIDKIVDGRPVADRRLVTEAVKLLACVPDAAAGEEAAMVLAQSQRAACQMVAMWAVRDDTVKLMLYDSGVFEHLRRLSGHAATGDVAQAALKALGVSFLAGH